MTPSEWFYAVSAVIMSAACGAGLAAGILGAVEQRHDRRSSEAGQARTAEEQQ